MRERKLVAFCYILGAGLSHKELCCLQINSPMQPVDGFESDRESEEGQAEQPHPNATSGKSKASATGRAEQRRTRKREKVLVNLTGSVQLSWPGKISCVPPRWTRVVCPSIGVHLHQVMMSV